VLPLVSLLDGGLLVRGGGDMKSLSKGQELVISAYVPCFPEEKARGPDIYDLVSLQSWLEDACRTQRIAAREARAANPEQDYWEILELKITVTWVNTLLAEGQPHLRKRTTAAVTRS
jgi:hypothetical protein